MAKRLNGEGSVSARPRADGLWVARYTVVEEGVTRRPVLYGKTRAEAARRLRTALVARDDALKSRVAKEIVDDSSAVRQEGAHPPRPESVDPRGARCSTRYIRIADVTPGGVRDVWIHSESIESVEATDNGQTIVRLRSGRPLLVNRQLDAVLQAVGHEDG